jgi:hypothetical protein
MTLAFPNIPDLPQPEAPVVPRAEQYHAEAGTGTMVASVTTTIITARKGFIFSPHQFFLAPTWHFRAYRCKRCSGFVAHW